MVDVVETPEPPATVLVISPDNSLLSTAGDALSDAGFSVWRGNDVQQGLAFSEGRDWTVLVVDIDRLPDNVCAALFSQAAESQRLERPQTPNRCVSVLGTNRCR